jgi:hypothetical protein
LSAAAVAGGSLQSIAGDVIDLVPPLNVHPGTVLLTLRHGKPVSIVCPGKKLRRGRGLPLTMSPQGVAISTQSVPVTLRVDDIALKGPYPLAQVEAELRIRVDDADDYAGLKEYVRTRGLNFAQLLDAEVANELDGRVRDQLAPLTAAEIYERGNITSLVDLRAPLLDGLFCVETVVKATPKHHPEFQRAREAVAKSSTDAAEKMLELHEQLPLDRRLSEARDQQLLDEALRRGLSIAELENPELVLQARQGELEIKKALIEQLDALRRGGGSDVIREVLGYLGGTGQAAGTAPPPTALSQGAAHGPADIDAEAHTDVHAPVLALPALRTDATLAHFWRAAGLPGEPMGIGLDVATPDVTVLVVCSEQLDHSAAEAAQRVYRERVDATTVIAIPGVQSLQDLVAGYLFSRMPELADARPTVEVLPADNNLRVRLSSDTQRMSRFLSRLNDPDSRMLQPLAQVLPYDHLEVVAADPS